MSKTTNYTKSRFQNLTKLKHKSRFGNILWYCSICKHNVCKKEHEHH